MVFKESGNEYSAAFTVQNLLRSFSQSHDASHMTIQFRQGLIQGNSREDKTILVSP
jgi:hypothetical protein